MKDVNPFLISIFQDLFDNFKKDLFQKVCSFKACPKNLRYYMIPILKTILFLKCLGPISFAHSHL